MTEDSIALIVVGATGVGFATIANFRKATLKLIGPTIGWTLFVLFVMWLMIH